MESTTFFALGNCVAFVLMLLLSFSASHEFSFGANHLVAIAENSPGNDLMTDHEANLYQKVPHTADEPVSLCQLTIAPKFPRTEVTINDQKESMSDLLGKQIEYLNPHI